MITKFNTSSAPATKSSSGSGLLVGLVLALAAGAVYYFGVYKPRKDKEKEEAAKQQDN